MWITDMIRKVVRRLFPVNAIEQKLNVKIASSSKMEEAISLWRQMYQNEAYWLGGDDNIRSQNLPASIAGEFARLILTEFSITVEGSERADYIFEQMKKHLIKDLDNRIEYWCAIGGIVLKPFIVDDDTSDESQYAIRIDYIGADRFYPTAFDSNGDVTGAVFIETKLIERRLYTRVEYHDLRGNHYKIVNRAFVSERLDSDDITEGFAVQNQFNEEVPLGSVHEWEGISPLVEMDNIRRPFFAYVKVPMANNIDTSSPLGVSVYSRAVDVIMESDKQYSRTLWEYEAKEAAVDADADLFKKDVNGNPILPEGKERLYRTYDTDDSGTMASIRTYSPDIRDGSMLNGQENLMRRIEFLVGLAYGTLSNPAYVDKTATEVMMSKQRSYVFVNRMQEVWDMAFDEVIDVMDMLCTLYDIVPEGSAEKTCTWGDGVLEDTDKEYTRRWQMVTAGKLKPEKFLSWYFGCSEEEAMEMMPVINEFPAYE